MAGQKMSDEARIARNAYYRAWRAKNPDKVRAANDRYWAKIAKKAAAEIAQRKEAEAHENAGN